jgi:hypothetical protein
MSGSPVTVTGLQGQEGETAFAFLVLRLREPRARDAVVALLRYLAPLIPDADAFIDEWADDDADPVQFIGMPWTPPDAGHAVDAQRRLIEGTGGLGVEAAWFFQTGTSLPSVDDDEPPDDDDDLDHDGDDGGLDEASLEADEIDAELEADDEDTGEREPVPASRKRRGRDRATTRDDSQVGDATDTSVTTPVPRMGLSDLDLDDDGHEGDDLGDELGARARRARRTHSVAGEIGGRGPDDLDDVEDDDDDLDTSVSMSALTADDEDDVDDDDAADDDAVEDDNKAGVDVHARRDAASDDRDGADDDVDDDAANDADDDADDDGAETAEWSAGPPPEVTQVRFPVDGYPAILDEHDWQDFGIAVKFAGPVLPGQPGVLFGFHSMWLAPYGGRFRNTAVTFDRAHNAAHFWVDRFAIPTKATQQVHHLLWVIAKLDEVIPVVHARFAEASMSQKYGGLTGETSEAFVLGGNPLLANGRAARRPAPARWCTPSGGSPAATTGGIARPIACGSGSKPATAR